MYIPSAFAVEDVPRLHAFMAEHSFALLTSLHDGQLFATHLPLLVEPASDNANGGFGLLIGHVARANPQWCDMEEGEVLAVFGGPHAYISPTWYAAENVVPTWNYVAVHAYGKLELVEDELDVLNVLRRTVDTYERKQQRITQQSVTLHNLWTYSEDDSFVRRLAAAVVAFRVRITRLEGTWKLNQNQPAERRARVIKALATNRSDDAQAIARLMAEL